MRYDLAMLDPTLLAPEKPRALKRSEYDRLVALGVFEGERLELLDGVLVAMSPNHPEHASPIQALSQLLIPALSGRAIVRVQLPLLAAGESEPEPDLAVVPLGDYRHTHPDRVHCVIEVAQSSVLKDRTVKAALYAASGFPEYWLVNVAEGSVEVRRDPARAEYGTNRRFGLEDTVGLEAFPDVLVRVTDIFG